MKFFSTSILILQALRFSSATTPCKNDACYKAVVSQSPPLPAVRKADCSSFLKIVVVPKTVTVKAQATITGFTRTIPTTDATITETVTQTTVLAPGPERRELEERQNLLPVITAGLKPKDVIDLAILVAKGGKVVVASNKPSYVGACNVLQYASACLCFGVGPTISIAPTPTYTSTITITATATETTFLTATVQATAIQTTCPTPQTLCGTSCKNLQTDEANCGTCGNACTAPGASCIEGACTFDQCTEASPQCAFGAQCSSNNSGCDCNRTDLGNRCADTSGLTCGTTQACSSTSECASGYACVLSVCCDRARCIPTTSCTNTAAPRVLFRIGGASDLHSGSPKGA